MEMKNVVTEEAREIFLDGKLAKVRKICPGRSEAFYQIVEYVALNIGGHELSPTGVIVAAACVMDDLQTGQCGFAGKNHGAPIPEYLLSHRDEVLGELPYIMQVIDKVTGPEFAERTREEFKINLGWNVPKYVEPASDDLEAYPKAVRVAVDWWSDMLQHPEMDNGDPTMAMFMATLGGSGAFAKNFSADEMRAFRATLAEAVGDALKEYGQITLHVDYQPDGALAMAGAAAGINRPFAFPFKTTMWVENTSVKVRAGYTGELETLWTRTAALD